MEQVIIEILDENRRVMERFFTMNIGQIAGAANLFAACIRSGGKILFFGNGGSAADSQHLAAEFVNRFRIERPPLAALALTTDTSVLTSIGNDYDFDEIFEKQIRAIGKKGDVAVGISTSGNSKNVVNALARAKEMGLHTVGFCGRGGKVADIAEMVFKAPSDTTARIQEVHITLGHVLCELVDRILFEER